MALIPPILRVHGKITASVPYLQPGMVHIDLDLAEFAIPLLLRRVISEHVVRAGFLQAQTDGPIDIIAVVKVSTAGINGSAFQGVLSSSTCEGFFRQGAVGINTQKQLTLRVKA